MLSVNDRVDFLTLNSMYKIVKGMASTYLCNINLTSDRHVHNTRFSSMSYQVPSVKGYGLASLKYNAIKLWNAIPTNIKNQDSIESFKSAVNSFFLERSLSG